MRQPGGRCPHQEACRLHHRCAHHRRHRCEVTINYVITDVEKKRKFVCVDTNDIPEVAVVDPDMMASMPKGLTAATGMTP